MDIDPRMYSAGDSVRLRKPVDPKLKQAALLTGWDGIKPCLLESIDMESEYGPSGTLVWEGCEMLLMLDQLEFAPQSEAKRN